MEGWKLNKVYGKNSKEDSRMSELRDLLVVQYLVGQGEVGIYTGTFTFLSETFQCFI